MLQKTTNTTGCQCSQRSDQESSTALNVSGIEPARPNQSHENYAGEGVGSIQRSSQSIEQRGTIGEAIDQSSQRSIESLWRESYSKCSEEHEARNKHIALDLNAGTQANFINAGSRSIHHFSRS